MNADKNGAREAARRILQEHNVKRAPVQIERIIKNMGIVLDYAPLDEELSGMAFVKDGVSIIGLNALHHPNRQRFSAAHELAHHILHEPKLHEEVHVSKGLRVLRRDPTSSKGTSKQTRSLLNSSCQKSISSKHAEKKGWTWTMKCKSND